MQDMACAAPTYPKKRFFAWTITESRRVCSQAFKIALETDGWLIDQSSNSPHKKKSHASDAEAP
jgi:hypothetical protein